MTLVLDCAELKSFQGPDIARLLSVGGWDAQRRQRGKATPATGSGHRVWREALSPGRAPARARDRRASPAARTDVRRLAPRGAGSSPSAGRDAGPPTYRGDR